jgi:pimeloyl-ACP methyl ester carboxylesterase
MAPETKQHVALRDGRVVELLRGGEPSATAVLFHHGTPFSPVPYAPLADAVGARDLAFLAWSRPGYASSTRQAERCVADVAADAVEVLDALGHERVIAIGWSGGGPHALACGALLGGRCAAVATIGGVAPHDAEGLAWLEGMGPENIEEFTLAEGRGEGFHQFLDAAAAQFGRLTGPDVAASLGGLVSDVDIASLRGDFADYLARGLAASVANGTGGWYDDDVAFTSPWGFDLGSIACPVAIWQGAQDRMVPLAHGRWLADRVPGAHAHLLPDEGHISLVVRSFAAILDDALALVS